MNRRRVWGIVWFGQRADLEFGGGGGFDPTRREFRAYVTSSSQSLRTARAAWSSSRTRLRTGGFLSLLSPGRGDTEWLAGLGARVVKSDSVAVSSGFFREMAVEIVHKREM